MSEDSVEDIIAGISSDDALNSEEAAAEAIAKNTSTKEPEKVEETKETKETKETVQEVKSLDVSEKVADTTQTVEDLAAKLGWNKDHQGPDKVDATAFILKSRDIQDTMGAHNKDLKNQLGSLQKSIVAIQEHNENVYKAEVKKLEADLTALKKEKRTAVELADVVKVDELDEQIESIQKDLSKPKEVSEQNTENPVYDEWIKDNEWYETDDEMAKYAEAVSKQYVGAPIEKIYSMVRQKVQEVFPEKFEVAPQEVSEQVIKKVPVGPVSPVESASNREKQATFTADDLTSSQRTIMNDFVKRGIMTEKQYVDDIAKLQEG